MKKIKLTLTLFIGFLSFTSVMAQTKSTAAITDYHQAATTKFIEVNGTRYAYRILGNKIGIPLILLQHFTGTMDNWDPAVTNGLAQQFKVILVDNKGISSSGGKTPDNIAEMAKDIEDFIHALGYQKVNMLGFSMGGFVAQQIVLDQPQLINKLILAGTGPKGGDGIADIVKPLTIASKMSPDEQKLYLFYSPSTHSQAMGKLALARIHKRIINRDPEASQEAVMAQLKSILAWAQPDPNFKEQLKLITQPVLIINGNNDIVVPTINSYFLFQYLPNAKLSLFPDSNHGSIFQYHELFLAEAIPFLKN